MCNIPSEVFRQILCRLQAQSLLRFRCVCKEWRDIIDDPIFPKLQLIQMQTPSTIDSGHLILRGDYGTDLYALSLESIGCEKTVKPVFVKNCPFSSYGGDKPLIYSCNGVMLMYYSKGISFLWNPLTSDYHRLPPFSATINKSMRLYHSVTGFGYDSVADDYKIVRIGQVFDPRNRTLISETLVYSLKLDCWSKIRDFPFRVSRMRGGVFMKGALHWICSTMPQKQMDDLIVGLDLATEDYCFMSLPCESLGGHCGCAKHLGNLGGYLMLSCYYQNERLEVWVMKDYGVNSSWIKLLSIVKPLYNGVAVETLRAIALSKCRRRVLLQHDSKEFVWFDLETKLVKRVGICGRPATFSSQVFVGSLVRVNGSRTKKH